MSDLERAFVDRHGGFDLGVHGGQILADLNCHQVARNESHLVNDRRSSGSSHGEYVVRVRKMNG